MKEEMKINQMIASLIRHSYCLHVGIKRFVRSTCLQCCTCSTATDCMKGTYTNLFMVKFQTSDGPDQCLTYLSFRCWQHLLAWCLLKAGIR